MSDKIELESLRKEISDYQNVCQYLISAVFLLLENNCDQESRDSVKKLVTLAKDILES